MHWLLFGTPPGNSPFVFLSLILTKNDRGKCKRLVSAWFYIMQFMNIIEAVDPYQRRL